jgi:hypothetical protein
MPAALKPTARTRETIGKMKKFDCKAGLRRELAEDTSGMTAAVKTAARRIDSGRGKKSAKASPGGSLRAAVASTVRRTIKIAGKLVVVAIVAVPRGGKSNLVRAVEGDIPWKHPTYGHKPGVEQPPKPFFFKTLESFAPGISERVEATLNRYTEKKL